MIRITIYKDKNKDYVGLKALGHAGAARYGSDVVCAAVSVLITNTFNAIESLTEETLKCKTDESRGLMAVKFNKTPGSQAALLMVALVLGLKAVEAQHYNRGYIRLNFKEV